VLESLKDDAKPELPWVDILVWLASRPRASRIAGSTEGAIVKKCLCRVNE
jgi:hypothetical protein